MKKAIYLLSALLFTTAALKSQSIIPNAGFENWTNMSSYNNPDSWDCLNSMTSSMSTYTCMKGTPGATGAAYIKLTSKSVSGMGIMPGIATSGILNSITLEPTSGFPFTGRPQSLNGKWQYMASGNDQGFIKVLLTKWNTSTMMRDTIAFKKQLLSGMAMSWANFSLPLTYMNGNAPDSCIIVLSASKQDGIGAVANSYLYVDNISFTGSVTGISTNHLNTTIKLFPNPVVDKLNIDLSAIKDKKVTLEIVDVQGKLWKSIMITEPSATTSLDITELPKGNFLLNVIMDEGITTKAFIK